MHVKQQGVELTHFYTVYLFPKRNCIVGHGSMNHWLVHTNNGQSLFIWYLLLIIHFEQCAHLYVQRSEIPENYSEIFIYTVQYAVTICSYDLPSVVCRCWRVTPPKCYTHILTNGVVIVSDNSLDDKLNDFVTSLNLFSLVRSA